MFSPLHDQTQTPATEACNNLGGGGRGGEGRRDDASSTRPAGGRHSKQFLPRLCGRNHAAAIMMTRIRTLTLRLNWSVPERPYWLRTNSSSRTRQTRQPAQATCAQRLASPSVASSSDPLSDAWLLSASGAASASNDAHSV